MTDRPRPSVFWRGGLHAAVGVARALGPLRYPVADGIAMCVYAAQPSRRRRAALNHRRADPSLSHRESRRRARRSFREYGRTTADFIWANGLDDATVLRHVEVEGMDLLHAARASGTGAVATLSHFGNWDMGANAALAVGLPLTTVMAPLGPPSFTDLVAWARERNRLEVFTPRNALRGLLRALRANRVVALLCDIPEEGPTVTVEYCGGPVPFSAVPAWLALRTGAPLFPVECVRLRDGRYRVVAHPAVPVRSGDDAQTVMQRVARALEPAVRSQPAQWYPFGAVYADCG